MEGINLNDFSSLISDVGFAYIVTGFLLLRIDKKLDQLNQTLLDMVELFIKSKN